MSLGSTTSSLSPLSNISIASPPAPPPAAITPRPQPSPITATTVTTCQRSDAPGKDKNRKKSKIKSQPKTRTIKFHEYKVSTFSILSYQYFDISAIGSEICSKSFCDLQKEEHKTFVVLSRQIAKWYLLEVVSDIRCHANVTSTK